MKRLVEKARSIFNRSRLLARCKRLLLDDGNLHRSTDVERPRKILHNQTLIQTLLTLAYIVPLAIIWVFFLMVARFPWMMMFAFAVWAVLTVWYLPIAVQRYINERKGWEIE